MAKQKQIYVKASKTHSAGWLTINQARNWISKGEKLEVSETNKNILKDLNKKYKEKGKQYIFKQKTFEKVFKAAEKVGQKVTKKEFIKFYNSSERKEIEFYLGEIKEGKISNVGDFIRFAEPVKINQSAINDLRNKARKPDGTFYPKGFYQNILIEVKKKDIDLTDYLVQLSKKNNNVVTYADSEMPANFFSTGNFVDLLTKDEEGNPTGDKIKKGCKFTIIGFDGEEKEFTSVGNALKMMKELNARINDTIDIINAGINKKKKSLSFGYITIPQTVTSNSNREITAIKFDFSKYSSLDIDKAEFDYYLNED